MFPPEHRNRTISGKSVFVYVVKGLKVRPSGVSVAPNPIERVLMRQKRRNTNIEEKPREGRDRRAAAASLGMPGAPQSWKRQEEPYPGASGGTSILEHLDLRCLVSRTGGG